MNAHTPGPWTWQGAMNSPLICIGRDSGSAMQGMDDPETVAVVKMHGDESAHNQGKQCANARLISAAPELLESLEFVAAYLRACNDAHAASALCHASAAIAKARGEA